MAAPARIDADRIADLEHRFAAHPRRYVAPLANALRAAGAYDRAVTLLRGQLAEQPRHLTGHVILGQALFEAGDLAEAEHAFDAARALDPANRVVLRHLGEIASLRGDDATARLWFERLRAADPYADDVAAQFGGAAAAPFEVEADVPVTPPAGGPVQAPAAAAVDAESFELLEFEPGLPVLDPVVGLDEVPADPLPRELDAVASDEEATAEKATALDALVNGAFATETMARLLVLQGHTEQAIAVYERLVAERPDDVELRGRLDALRGPAVPGIPEASGADEAPVSAASDAAAHDQAHDHERAALLAAAFADLGPERGAAVAEPSAAPPAAPSAAVPAAVPDDGDPFADLSFDRFFPAADAPSTDAVDAPTSDADSGDDDLARFDAWLRGESV